MNIEKREITTELQESYLNYAMSVIVSRALPDVRDGLKPVQRRILWAMWDSGLAHLSKTRKSANVVGETMARYHPHGDSSIYDALARMAQDFSLRYPLVLGQGNWGSIDGDSPAAMRYTEAKLSKISEEMLLDIEKETVDWQSNYDDTRQEPKVLPAKLPNLLLNGTVGIAVGMATNIPPHNLSEVADAVLYFADNQNADTDDLLKFVKGPDFPTGGIIFDQKGIREVYASGRGPILTRAKTDIQERKNRQLARAGGFDIIITEIPYQVNKSELIKHIAELVTNKRIEGIRDIRDESDREGMRVVIELKTDANPQKILNQLYQYTDLQKHFHMNMIALADGIQPQIMTLKDVISAYFEHRKKIVRRRTEFDLKKARERAHILEGLAKALSVIDKIIAVIKKSKDKNDAHQNLVKQFKLSDIQTNAILEMRLQTLAALERKKIEDELKEKMALIKDLEIILKSPAKIVNIIKSEVKELKEKYGGERKTAVVVGGVKTFSDEDLVPEEEAVITLSAGGYIKRLPPDAFKAQKRGGKGLIGSDVSEEDLITQFFGARTHDNVLFFTDRGRVFQTKVYEIPAASRTSKGRAIHNFLELPSDENVSAVISYADKRGLGTQINADKNLRESASHLRESAFLVMVTKGGVIKKTAIEDFKNIRRNGIIAISLKKGDALNWVRLSSGGDQVFLGTKNGQAIRFKESQVRPMSRTAGGIRAIRLKKGDMVAGFDIIRADADLRGFTPLDGFASNGAGADQRGKVSESQREVSVSPRVLVVMANGFGKQTPLKEYKLQNRGGSGIKTANITAKTGQLVAAQIIAEQTELLALSEKGQIIRTALSEVRKTGRSAQGVRIMNLKSGDKLAGIVVI
ncbi:MAG: DNA gyrase subunit A [bacterium]|nr:DNA gyrase subunit A [bacterium]